MFIPSGNSFTAAEQIRIADATPVESPAAMMPGLALSTLLETPSGWVQAGTLLPGMRVGTWDGGFAEILHVLRHQIRFAPGRGLIHVPGGALDNCDGLTLLPSQEVLVESDLAEAVTGTPAVLVPAAALIGLRGIARIDAPDAVDVVSPVFADDEVVYANSGTLLFCPGRRGSTADFFPRLSIPQGRALCEMLADANAGGWPLAA